MSKSKSIKCRIGSFNLRRRLKNLKRNIITHNFNTAKTAGILFSYPDEESFNFIKEFLSFLSNQEMNVIALGYVPGKKVPQEFLMRKGINFYCNTDLNWYYKPKSELIDQFIDQEFDILFDLSIKQSFTTEYVGSLSKAAFKIGAQLENPYPDMVFDIKKNKSTEYLIEQIKHYLNILNN